MRHPRLRHFNRIGRNRRSGSALIWTMLLSGLLLLSIAPMLLSVRDLTRATSDKLAWEECYHVATGGVQMANAWLLNPALAGKHLGSTVGSAVEGVTSGAVDMSTDVIIVPGYALAGMSTGQMVSDYFTGKYNGFAASGASLSDGRKVIYEFPSIAGRVIVFQNDAVGKMTASLFSSSAPNPRSYVSRLRITTPYPAKLSGKNGAGSYSGENLGLRRVSLIIEAEAVTLTQGQTKRRIIQEKVLVFPPLEGGPALSMGEAIISGAGIMVQGSSSLNVHWGPVKAKGDLDLLDIGPLNVADKTLNAAGKFFGAGIGSEHWLRWTTSGKLYNKSGGNRTPLFPAAINGVAVTDFVAQLLNNDFGTNWTNGTFRLLGTYSNQHIKSVTNPNNGDAPDLIGGTSAPYPVGSGAFVQNTPSVGVEVDEIMNNTMDYTTWKQFAIKRNGYARPTMSGGTVTGYTNANGHKLYVSSARTLTTNPIGHQAFMNLAQISMKPLVPANGNTTNLADRILFIDTAEGTKGGTKLNISLGSNDAFFWKGLLYMNANFNTSGGGAFPTILCKNPDHFRLDPTGNTGVLVANCYIDGVLTTTGNMTRTGNAAVYGTLLAMEGYGGSGGPDIYYNSRNGEGLFKGLHTHAATFQIIEGPITEMNQWPL